MCHRCGSDRRGDGVTFCRPNKGRVHFVVVFNLTRFARDKHDHFALRSHLQSLGSRSSRSMGMRGVGISHTSAQLARRA